ncbi:Nucleotidyltransferase domain protein [Candidatus Brocadiaceae bacterium B188]|nr:Nucleotidyltransferase domain protein [Candidatus Brocadiaceae bacterium B188]
MKTSHVRKEYLSMVKDIVIAFLKDEEVKVILFGSRARGNNQISSDVDVGIIPAGKFREERITLLKEKIENINIPYKVEIVNLSEVSEEFKREAMKDAIIWKD